MLATPLAPASVVSADDRALHMMLAQTPVVDVRAPSEFAKGHYPGAVNVPLLTDDERAAVGTCYKKSGKEAALALGWTFVNDARLAELVAQARRVAPGGQAIVHCARGGLRSRSVGWWLTQAGFSVRVLEGGYKTIRRRVLEEFTRPWRLCVLSGKTGSSKTAVLHALLARGEQVLDLERHAHHKGSVFGALGEREQPTNEQFENDLAARLFAMDPLRPMWVEDESLRIGKCAVPIAFWNHLRTQPVIVIDVSVAQRLRVSMDVFGTYPAEELTHAISRAGKRLGGARMQAAMQAVTAGDRESAARIMLAYYDDAYEFGLTQRASQVVQRIALADDTSADEAATLVMHAAQAIAWPSVSSVSSVSSETDTMQGMTSAGASDAAT